jgi:hypothetical protein
MISLARSVWAPWLLAMALLAGCSTQAPPEPKKRTLAEARQIALGLFGQLDKFELVKQREVGLAGRPAVRMEASWEHAGQKRQGILYVLDHPNLFNVLVFTAPEEGDMFEAGYPVFQEMIKSLRIIRHLGPLTVKEEGGSKVLRSPELQLEIRYPADWVYSLDDVNRALVFSGPRESPAWLTTVSFSVINKFEPQPE